MTYHIVHHVVRRGVESFSSQYAARQQDLDQLEQDAELYEKVGEEVKPMELLPVLITGIIAFLVIASIDYTLGNVISALTMIESPSRTAIIDSAPPPYKDAEDKEPLVPADEPADVEVLVVEHKPITSSIRTTIAHLHNVGGFRARWRGIGLYMFYQFLLNLGTNFISYAFGFGLFGAVCAYVFVSLGLARIHAAWTHSMIAHPTAQPWFRRLPSRKDCKVLLLPTFVYAIATQATNLLPIGVALALGQTDGMRDAAEECPRAALVMTLRFLAVPATYILVGLAVLFPASVTLTRIEATLLPEDMQTIVSFDKAAIMGEVDLTVRGGCRVLFVQAWRSFDSASRLRLVKLYVKTVLAEVMVAFVAVHLMVAELYVLGAEKMAIFFKSAAAQLKLMAIKQE